MCRRTNSPPIMSKQDIKRGESGTRQGFFLHFCTVGRPDNASFCIFAPSGVPDSTSFCIFAPSGRPTALLFAFLLRRGCPTALLFAFLRCRECPTGLRTGIGHKTFVSIMAEGVMPKCLVKQRVKYLGSLKPTS